MNLSRLNENSMAEFESGWQTSINKTPNKNVAVMISTKKSIKLDGKPEYYTELIYKRVICIQQYRDVDITYVLSGQGTFLKTKFQVEQSSRIQRVPDDVIIDGCALL